MDNTLLDQLDAALHELATAKGVPPDRQHLEGADEGVLQVLLAAAERAAKAQAQVWALVEATVETDRSLVVWPARRWDDLSATGEEAKREDARIREYTAASVRNQAQWRREALEKVSELLEESRQRLEDQVQRAEAEIAAGPPPRQKSPGNWR